MHIRTANPKVNIAFSDNLYKTSDRLNPDKIKNNILSSKKQRSIYLIADSEKEGEMFVIYRANELMLPIYDNTDISIVGIGKGRRNTLKLLGDILIDMNIDKVKHNDNSIINS